MSLRACSQGSKIGRSPGALYICSQKNAGGVRDHKVIYIDSYLQMGFPSFTPPSGPAEST